MTERVQPLEYVRSLLSRNHAIREIELSTYVNVPESLTDLRESSRVKVKDVLRRFSTLVQSLRPEQEIAFHSRVHVRIETGAIRPRHLALVDFKTSDRGLAEEAAGRLVAEHGSPSAAFFASGRSYHLYIGVLLSEAHWTKFMGRVLLLNPRTGAALVDSRWIGHRLMSGFGALRWSANTPPYVQPPQLLREWSAQG